MTARVRGHDDEPRAIDAAAAGPELGRVSDRSDHAILMSIDPLTLVITLIAGLAIGVDG